VPKVAVLMCTMQAQHFLAEQLNSDRHPDPPALGHLGIRRRLDDHTHAILEYYQSHWGEDRISIHAGPAEGSTANFLSLTCRADIEADYFAYADQDDVWESDKLERAVAWLQTVPPDVPALYGSRTLLVDARNQHIGYSPLFERAAGASATPWCRASPAATPWCSTARRATCCARPVKTSRRSPTTGGPTCWSPAAAGGCHYDPIPHGALSPARRQPVRCQRRSGGAAASRAAAAARAAFRGWVDANLKALQRVRHLMTPENQQVLDEFVAGAPALARRTPGGPASARASSARRPWATWASRWRR
jgi:hypothetical protein